MAGSRMHKIGTIYSRMTGLLQAGAIKPSDKPIWYDVYTAFPPMQEPKFDREVLPQEIPNIFYSEDLIRAKFYRKYGSPGILNLFEDSSSTSYGGRTKKRPSFCEAFVKAYTDLEEQGVSEEQCMEQAERELETQGIYLDRQRMPNKFQREIEPLEEVRETKKDILAADLPHDILHKVHLADIFKESYTKNDREAMDIRSIRGEISSLSRASSDVEAEDEFTDEDYKLLMDTVEKLDEQKDEEPSIGNVDLSKIFEEKDKTNEK